MQVDPNGKILELTDKELFNYPFLYMIEPGHIELRDDEIKALRKYLLNGGFLMIDDFWGSQEWDNFAFEMRRVFPKRKFTELDLKHPIFHCVFDLKSQTSGSSDSDCPRRSPLWHYLGARRGWPRASLQGALRR